MIKKKTKALENEKQKDQYESIILDTFRQCLLDDLRTKQRTENFKNKNSLLNQSKNQSEARLIHQQQDKQIQNQGKFINIAHNVSQELFLNLAPDLKYQRILKKKKQKKQEEEENDEDQILKGSSPFYKYLEQMQQQKIKFGPLQCVISNSIKKKIMRALTKRKVSNASQTQNIKLPNLTQALESKDSQDKSKALTTRDAKLAKTAFGVHLQYNDSDMIEIIRKQAEQYKFKFNLEIYKARSKGSSLQYVDNITEYEKGRQLQDTYKSYKKGLTLRSIGNTINFSSHKSNIIH